MIEIKFNDNYYFLSKNQYFMYYLLNLKITREGLFSRMDIESEQFNNFI